MWDLWISYPGPHRGRIQMTSKMSIEFIDLFLNSIDTGRLGENVFLFDPDWGLNVPQHLYRGGSRWRLNLTRPRYPDTSPNLIRVGPVVLEKHFCVHCQNRLTSTGPLLAGANRHAEHNLTSRYDHMHSAM